MAGEVSSPARGAFAPCGACGGSAALPSPLLLGGAVFAALMLLAERLLGDPDSHWHVAVGSRIWRDGAVPWFDAYSHTVAGAPWIAKEWLSQLLLFGAHAAAGWAGVVALSALALAATFALLYRQLERRLRTSLALALTILSVLFLAPHFLARPHVFALVPLLGWTAGLSGAAERGRAPSPWLLAVLVLWANLHGSFTIAYPIAALLAADALLAAEPGRRRTLAARWALFGLGAVAAGCATPYGLHSMVVTATVFGSGESLPFLTEWQPLALDATGIAAAALAALLTVVLAREPLRNAARIALLALLAAMMVRHTRFLDVFALVAPVVAAGPVLRRWPALRREPSPAAAAAGSWLAALALAAVSMAALLSARGVEPSPAVTPTAALAAAERAGIEGPVYNDYDFGGALMARGIPTFVDGRTDQLYLGGFISGLFRAVRAPDGTAFLALLDRYGVTWALVRTGGAESRHLDGAAGWSRLHQDPVAAVYRRTGPAPAWLPLRRQAP